MTTETSFDAFTPLPGAIPESDWPDNPPLVPAAEPPAAPPPVAPSGGPFVRLFTPTYLPIRGPGGGPVALLAELDVADLSVRTYVVSDEPGPGRVPVVWDGGRGYGYAMSPCPIDIYASLVAMAGADATDRARQAFELTGGIGAAEARARDRTEYV